MAVVAPMPKPTVVTIASAVIGTLDKPRSVIRRSCSRSSNDMDLPLRRRGEGGGWSGSASLPEVFVVGDLVQPLQVAGVHRPLIDALIRRGAVPVDDVGFQVHGLAFAEIGE